MSRTKLLAATVGIAIPVACTIAVLAALAVAPDASAESRDHGASFAVRCDFSHRSSDDPIVHPGHAGMAHSHDYFGNRSAGFDSTYESMISAPTTCTRPEDTAGYWLPTVSWNGAKVEPSRAVFYYRAGGKDHKKVRPYAAGLKVINASGVSWYCGGDDGKRGSKTPPRRCGSGVLGLRVIFGDCVERDPSGGQKLDSADHRAHVVRSVGRGNVKRCPTAHPFSVPVLTINVNFDIPTTTGRVTLSSGAAATLHADFWNTWDQTELQRLVADCINEVPPSRPRPEACQARPS